MIILTVHTRNLYAYRVLGKGKGSRRDADSANSGGDDLPVRRACTVARQTGASPVNEGIRRRISSQEEILYVTAF